MNEKLEQIERTFANLNLTKLKYKDNNFEIEIEREDNTKNNFVTNNNSINAIDLEAELQKLKEMEEAKKAGLKSVVESLKTQEESCSDLVIVEEKEKLPVLKDEKLSLREELEKELETVEVKCPIVGIFYSKASPDKAPFVEVGTKVSKDDTLCIIEAMKMFTEIKSPVDGVVKSVRFSDEDLVGAEEVIFEIGE